MARGGGHQSRLAVYVDGTYEGVVDRQAPQVAYPVPAPAPVPTPAVRPAQPVRVADDAVTARSTPQRWHLHRYETQHDQDVYDHDRKERVNVARKSCSCGAQREVVRQYLPIGSRVVSIKRI